MTQPTAKSIDPFRVYQLLRCMAEAAGWSPVEELRVLQPVERRLNDHVHSMMAIPGFTLAERQRLAREHSAVVAQVRERIGALERVVAMRAAQAAALAHAQVGGGGADGPAPS